eukprot:scaffold3165_cov48-Attheya_sp.AAC.4
MYRIRDLPEWRRQVPPALRTCLQRYVTPSFVTGVCNASRNNQRFAAPGTRRLADAFALVQFSRRHLRGT